MLRARTVASLPSYTSSSRSSPLFKFTDETSFTDSYNTDGVTGGAGAGAGAGGMGYEDVRLHLIAFIKSCTCSAHRVCQCVVCNRV